MSRNRRERVEGRGGGQQQENNGVTEETNNIEHPTRHTALC